jgi:aurora kinase, other
MWKSAVLTQSAALAQQLKRPRLSDFLKIKLVGCGKFGRVHMAVDKRTGWLYALKSIRKSMLVKYGLVGQLIREVTIHLFVNHPNIIRLYSYFDDEHHVYLLSELGERGQLYKLLKARQRFPEREAVGLIVQVLSALKYLHDRRIVHRDLKPENLVVTGNQVKLTDFGWAAAMTDGNPRSTFCGTPEYVSPEIVKGEDYDESTDCWALGVLSYELLFGVSPFGIRNEKDIDKVLWKEVRFGAEGEVSGEAKDFISRLLERNQRLRMKLGEAREHPWLKVRA